MEWTVTKYAGQAGTTLHAKPFPQLARGANEQAERPANDFSEAQASLWSGFATSLVKAIWPQSNLGAVWDYSYVLEARVQDLES